MVRDRQGELWLGLEGGGLARFDGARFASYATEAMLGSSAVVHILEDGEGNLWFAGDGDDGRGLGRLDQQRHLFRCYGQEDGLIQDYVNDIALDRRGRVCVASAWGVSRFEAEQGQFAHFTVGDDMPGIVANALALSRSGDLWVGPWFSQQLVAWGGEGFRFHTCPFPARAFHHLLEDQSGRLWVAAWGWGTNQGTGLLWRFDGQRWERFSEEQGPEFDLKSDHYISPAPGGVACRWP